MKNRTPTSILLGLAFLMHVSPEAKAEIATRDQYKTLDMSFYKNTSTPNNMSGIDIKMTCSNRFGQTFESTNAGFNDCYSDFEKSKNVRELKDKSNNLNPTNSIGFTIQQG